MRENNSFLFIEQKDEASLLVLGAKERAYIFL
jgi:hypothetical protein